MRCPHCQGALPFILCPGCQEEIPERSLYCCWCGQTLKREEGEADFSERTLCSDGNCIGVINEQGRCNICGKPYAGEAP